MADNKKAGDPRADERRTIGSQIERGRCVWHFWRSLAGEMASAVAQVAESSREQVREEWHPSQLLVSRIWIS